MTLSEGKGPTTVTREEEMANYREEMFAGEGCTQACLSKHIAVIAVRQGLTLVTICDIWIVGLICGASSFMT
jgi:hypothetical protein